ncbi:hypothetical protein RRG08_028017 [Elysia crispata]|uniref:Transmembrane protein n=1 Tax=Elysia crispata TaxID=231223 RepID=A0AAE1BCR5_9GAST|nr:hypothetical protein RRG08_028017 [Elysia crispata]
MPVPSKTNFVDLLTVGTGVKSQDDDKVPVAPKDGADNRDSDGPCGKKCFVVTAVSLFLFLAFVALPAGAFLIISGRNTDDMGLQIGGAIVMCVPVLVAVILGIVCCVRRNRRKATFTSVSTARV